MVVDRLWMQIYFGFNHLSAETKSYCSVHHDCEYVRMNTWKRSCRGLLHFHPKIRFVYLIDMDLVFFLNKYIYQVNKYSISNYTYTCYKRDNNIRTTNEYQIAWKKNPSSVLLTSHQAYTKLIVIITSNQNFSKKWITKKMNKPTIKLELDFKLNWRNRKLCQLHI